MRNSELEFEPRHVSIHKLRLLQIAVKVTASDGERWQDLNDLLTSMQDNCKAGEVHVQVTM